MMPNVTRGSDAGGLMAYLAGPGRGNVHENPRVIDSSIGDPGPLSMGDARVVGRDLSATGLAYPGSVPKAGDIWHCSLSLPATEGVRSDVEWVGIVREFMEGMGFEDPAKSACRWVAVRHGVSAKGNDHVHIAASLVREDGTRVNTWRDWPRAQQLCSDIEQRRGLHVVQGRVDGAARRGVPAHTFAAARAAGVDLAAVELTVRAAAAASTTEAGFAKAVRAGGLNYRARVDPATGAPGGYSVQVPGSGTWIPGGRLGRDLTLPRLHRGWDIRTGTPDTPTPRRKGLNGPASAVTAELRGLQAQVASGKMSPAELADAAHVVAGALAQVASSPEHARGPVPQAARECGRIASTRTRLSAPVRRHAVAKALLLAAARDPASQVAQAVMVAQLLATFNAIRDAHKASAINRRFRMTTTADGIEEAVMGTTTIGVTMVARVAEGIARDKQARANADARQAPATDRKGRPVREQWTADTIARDRTRAMIEQRAAARARNPLPEYVPPDLADARTCARIGMLAAEAGLDVAGAQYRMTAAEAAAMTRDMEFAAGPERVAAVDQRLAAREAGQPLSWTPPGPSAEQVATDRDLQVVRNAAAGIFPSDGRGPQQVDQIPDRAFAREQSPARTVTPEQSAVDRTLDRRAAARLEPKNPEQWVTGDQRITPKQKYTLGQYGYSQEDMLGMSKANASQHISGDLTKADLPPIEARRAADNAFGGRRGETGGPTPGEHPSVQSQQARHDRRRGHSF